MDRVLQYTHNHMHPCACIYIHPQHIHRQRGQICTLQYPAHANPPLILLWEWQKIKSLASEVHGECFVGWLSGLIPLEEQATLVPTTSTGSAKWWNSISTLGLEQDKVMLKWTHNIDETLITQTKTQFLFKAVGHAQNSSCSAILYKDKVQHWGKYQWES